VNGKFFLVQFRKENVTVDKSQNTIGRENNVKNEECYL
jgi:hypothetical protein